MDPALIWILVGLVLLGAETILPGVFLLWIGLAAVGTGLVLLVSTPPFWVMVAVFVLLPTLFMLVAKNHGPNGFRASKGRHPNLITTQWYL